MSTLAPSSVAVKSEEPEPESEVQQADADDSTYEFLGFFEEEPADESASSSAAQSTTSTHCPYCDIVCVSSFVLKIHLTVSHTYGGYNGKLLKCISCKKLKPEFAFVRERPLATFSATCAVCSDFEEIEARRHGLAREGSVKRRMNSELKCPDCDFETSTKSYLFQHLAVAHNQVQLSRVKRFMACRKCKHVQPGQKFVHFDETSRTLFMADVCMRCSVPLEVFLRCCKYAVPSSSRSKGLLHAEVFIDLRRGDFEVVGPDEMNPSTEVPSDPAGTYSEED